MSVESGQRSLEIGQRIQLDLFGMRMSGLRSPDSRAAGTVVGLGPGVITVLLDEADGPPSEVTVSLGRVER
jgi:hypothetical protein